MAHLMDFFLLFNKLPIHVAFILAGLLFFRRPVFFGAWVNYLLAVFCSRSLQVLIAAPLINDLTFQKFGMPSGHTYVSLAIYGWLFLVVYCGYHHWQDVFAAWGFAGIQTVFLFYYLKKRPYLMENPRYLSRFLFLFGAFCLLFLKKKYYLHEGTINTFFVCCGVWIGSEIFPDWVKDAKLRIGYFFSLFFLCFLGIFVVNGLNIFKEEWFARFLFYGVLAFSLILVLVKASVERSSPEVKEM